MCHDGFILGLKKKSTIMVSDVDNAGSYACVGAEAYLENLYTSL